MDTAAAIAHAAEGITTNYRQGPNSARTLILVAHPDDETGGCAGLLQRVADPIVVFATEGAPADEFFWKVHGSQHNYALVRRHEASAALAVAGVQGAEFLSDHASGVRLADQELYRALPQAFEAVRHLMCRYEPDIVVVPAYEGGHPDHDACSFLGGLIRRTFGAQVWEMPLYHRSATGAFVRKRFREENGTELKLELSLAEARVRTAMAANYASQADLAEYISARFEYYRPQVDYDYRRPPHPGLLNYQIWEWPISPDEVCGHFTNALRTLEDSSQPTTAMPPLALAAHAGCGLA